MIETCKHLARSTRRHILAVIAALTTADADTRPSPVRAAAITTHDVDGGSVTFNSTSHALHSQVSDGDASGWVSLIIVVLLNDNTIAGNTRELDVAESNARDGAGLARLGLDANTVLRVGNSGVGDSNVLHGVVVTATDGSDGKTVTTRAGTASKDNVLR